MHATALTAFIARSRPYFLFAMAGVLGFGAFRTLQAKPPQPPEAGKSRPRLDRFGDPLPEGAIHRFGTQRFRHHPMFHIAFTPDGKQLIAGDGCSPLAVFDAATGRKLREVGKNSVGANALTGFAISPDGKQVACCGSDVFVWDLETGRAIRQLHCGLCREVVYSADGTKLAAAVKETTRGAITGVVLVDAATGKHVGEWTVIQKDDVSKFGFGGIALSPDGKYLAGCFYELHEERPFVTRIRSMRVWLLDAATGKRVRIIGSTDVPILSVAFQPSTDRLASFGNDGSVRSWDVATGKEVQRIPAAKGKEENDFAVLRFSADGRRCALLTDRAKYLTVLDTKEGRVIRRIEAEESRMWVAFAFSADGKSIATARFSDESCVQVWDVASGVERLADAGHRAAVKAISLSPNERTLISRDEQGREIHWDFRTGKNIIRSTGAREEAGEFVWSKDFSQKTLRGARWRLVYKNQRPALMEIWSREGAKRIRKTEAHGHLVPTIAVSPDGSLLVIAADHVNSTNYAVMLWDPEREEKPRILPGTIEGGSHLLFSHDGKRLLAGGGWGTPQFSKGSVCIWDVATALLVHKLPIGAAPGGLLLTADDHVLLICGLGNDATVHAWDIETGKELARMTDPSLKPPSDNTNYRTQPAITGVALSADERFLAVVSSWGDVSAVSIWETASWKLIRSFAPVSPRNDALAMVFSHDGRSLFVANSDATILEWDISGRGANGLDGSVVDTPNPDRLNVLWRRLAETPDIAYSAVWEMLDHPEPSLAFLRTKIRPIKPEDEKRVRQLLARLDSDSFAEREEASRQLRTLGQQFLPILRQTLKARPPVEAKKRLEAILEALDRGPSSEQRRLLRVLALLEWSDSREAGEQLRRLAEGAPTAFLTRAAKAAWQRRKF